MTPALSWEGREKRVKKNDPTPALLWEGREKMVNKRTGKRNKKKNG